MAVVVLMSVFLILIVGVSAMFNQKATLRRQLRMARRVAIADFPDGGVAKIVGRLEYLDEPMPAPLSERSCAAFEVVVHQKRDKSWYRIVREVQTRRFAVRDDTGVAHIDPGHAQLVIALDSHSQSGTFDDATPAEESFLQRHGRASQGLLFNKRLRYREGVLEAGEEVAVLGYGVCEPDPDAVGAARGYREGPQMRVVMSGNSKVPLVISDEPLNMGRRALPAPADDA